MCGRPWTDAELQFLRERRCDSAQGFLLGRPRPFRQECDRVGVAVAPGGGLAHLPG